MARPIDPTVRAAPQGRHVPSWRAMAMAILFALGACPATFAGTAGEGTVRIVEHDGRYVLEVDGAPFRVKGVGSGGHALETLAAHGGNAFRTWEVPADLAEARALLDEARAHGLKVAMGLRMVPGRQGFDYGDAAAVAQQQARLRDQVLALRDHPALLMWVAGNELNLENDEPAVWNAIDAVARMIHGIDPDHPVMTTLAGFDAALISEIKQRAPNLDLLGIQLYGDIDGFDARLLAAGWDGPYIVTEWGPTGHWESPLTAWGAPVEDDASRKAALIEARYARNIAPDTGRGLGAFAFLWGDKQERTPTWYGLLLSDGSTTPSVDALHYLWNGTWPEQRSPGIAPIRIDGLGALDSVSLLPGAAATARVESTDANGDPLDFRWYVLAESQATTVGGDPEQVPARIDVDLSRPEPGTARFKAPAAEGAYRLFVEVRDGTGRAAYANLPFRVTAAPGTDVGASTP
ncbi:hypothetical protein [Marilutibacter spongiae]|uniref:Glycoside hydrolase family 2 catalytic domain-containing protein n=1 Tax=Marilutibacter spongiae TaxID=2025720 RepID=A0A7W3TPF5_9GAMM|nr:hypothetical protein [Lysobacter spongiae]MBB1062093.1 hypothetical protein [Lysobacter spongiae]